MKLSVICVVYKYTTLSWSRAQKAVLNNSLEQQRITKNVVLKRAMLSTAISSQYISLDEKYILELRDVPAPLTQETLK